MKLIYLRGFNFDKNTKKCQMLTKIEHSSNTPNFAGGTRDISLIRVESNKYLNLFYNWKRTLTMLEMMLGIFIQTIFRNVIYFAQFPTNASESLLFFTYPTIRYYTYNSDTKICYFKSSDGGKITGRPGKLSGRKPVRSYTLR